MNNPTLLLLGGGYCLSHLAQHLTPGTFVLTTTSAEKQEAFTRLGYTAELVSLSEKTPVRELLHRYPSLETVIDSVPPIHNGSPTQGAEHIIAALPPNLLRFFYLSTTGVYGKRDGEWVTEESSCTPFLDRSRARVAVEQCYRAVLGDRLTVFRLSGICGPGRGMGPRMKRGAYRLPSETTRYTNRIHRDDITGVLLASLAARKPLPPVFNLNDDEPTLASEVVRFYRERFSLPEPQEITNEELHREAGRLTLNQRVSNALVKETLSYTFRYPSYRESAATEFESDEMSL
ncbi:hypothetical protein MRY87_05630 [bacterium]|nr:hypothetical protein [bacterium]